MKTDHQASQGLFQAMLHQALVLWKTRTAATALFVFSFLSALVFWTQVGKLAWLGQLVLVLSTCVLALLLALFCVRAVFVFRLLGQTGVMNSVTLTHGAVTLKQLATELAGRLNSLERSNQLLVKALGEERSRLVGVELCVNGFSFELMLNAGAKVSVVDIQAGVERFIPLSRDAIRNNWDAFMLHVDARHQQAVLGMVLRQFDLPQRESLVFGLRRRAGEAPVFLQMTLQRRTEADGVRVLGVCIDVSDLVVARELAEKADLAKTEFLATMSHELRTPLNAIVGFAKLLEDQFEPGQIQSDAKSISIAAGNLNRILTDILDFSRVEAKGIQLESIPFDINVILKEVHVLNKPLADQKHVEFTCSFDEHASIWVSGDYNRLRQIIQNLVSNALKFTASGFVHLKLSASQPFNGRQDLSIAVADSGIGISQVSMRKLFKRFSQANRGISREFGGSGLGLAISKGLVEMMGGRIDVTSEPGVGSVFTVYLNMPTATPVQVQPEQAGWINEQDAGLDILVVDDHPMNLKLLDRYLSKRLHQVDTALSGVEALDCAKNKRYDLILMDIDMPAMDGYQTTHAIRSDSTNINQNTFICALSGLSDEASKQQGLNAGMQQHLSKPVPFDQLDAMVRQLCEQKKRSNIGALSS